MTSLNKDEKDTFTVTLDVINSIFGISGDTLRVIAKSYGLTEEAVIRRAITDWVVAEIPGIDLDSPALSPDQIRMLQSRRSDVDKQNLKPKSTLRHAFDAAIKGESNGNASSTLPGNGENT
jgi:hypothetical protein